MSAVAPLRLYGRRAADAEASRAVPGQAPAAPPATTTGAAHAAVSFRLAVRADVPAIHALVAAHVAEGHLLPRSRADIARHAARFVVATQRGRIVACADLAPLGPGVAELRSLVVDASARSAGVATRLIDQLAKRAASEGRHTICAFTHAPQYFVDKGFTVVSHADVPEKIEADCRTCAQVGRCGQSAVILPLSAAGRTASAPASADSQVSPRHV